LYLTFEGLKPLQEEQARHPLQSLYLTFEGLKQRDVYLRI